MYNQMEAKNRFEGLLGLFVRVHEKVKQPINTLTELTALSSEARLLCEAFDEELNMYIEKCGNEMMYPPTIQMIIKIQALAGCTGIHLQMADARLNSILKNSAGIEQAAAESDALRWN